MFVNTLLLLLLLMLLLISVKYVLGSFKCSSVVRGLMKVARKEGGRAPTISVSPESMGLKLIAY